ncbi:hypothetical protein [Microbulbifer variabilis]|uniref:hypothetical protein n=1 Tax=Microbulbifer variabilis TaxID=266805 RepID=UPI001CFC530D|nr:hypothetical protein [Microbulbifer variabilis]
MIKVKQAFANCFSIVLCCFSLAVNAGDLNLKSGEVFEQMKSLRGDWKKEGDTAGNFYINFSQTARDTVMVENWLYKGESHSLTIYHMDKGNLLATHYCPQGNQPHLQLTSSDKSGQIEFSFKDATNLEDLNENHQHSLAFEWLEDDKILRTESYMENGELKPSSIRLVRK